MAETAKEVCAPNGFAILRVCCDCKLILGAKDDVTGAPIALKDLGEWHLLERQATTGALCDGCLGKFAASVTEKEAA